MVIACAGYRVAGPGHHQTTFDAFPLAMGKGALALGAYFEICRRKRNAVDYDLANVIAKTEADELVEKAHEFSRLVEGWILRHHPQFAP
jgi:hypothetical protein